MCPHLLGCTLRVRQQIYPEIATNWGRTLYLSVLIPTYWVLYLLKRRMPQPESFRLRRLSTNIAKKRRIVKGKVRDYAFDKPKKVNRSFS